MELLEFFAGRKVFATNELSSVSTVPLVLSFPSLVYFF
jgi:hypothetical protein